MTRVLGVMLLAALLAAPATAGHPSTLGPSFRFDLGAASINGHVVLGKRVSTVRKELGPPNAYTLHQRYGFFRYGPRSARVSLMFRIRHGVLRVTEIAVTSPFATEARTGRILRVDPERLQRRIVRAYAGRFRLAHPYACGEFGCRGLFRSVTGKERISFGQMESASARGRSLLLYI